MDGTPTDLMSAARGAVFRALEAHVPPELCSVFDDLPQETKPPFLKIGAIDSENEAGKGDQVERLTVEVVAIYQGEDRGVLLAMLHAARAALDRQSLEAAGVYFQPPRFLMASASDASATDGVTYAGIINHEVYAEPA